ncbi:MAG: hypothetical protein ACO20H_04090 [Bacteriovoracaceae bacterium]
MIKESNKTILINYLSTGHKRKSNNIRGEIDESYFRLTALNKYDTIKGIREQALKKDLIEDPRYDNYFFK